MPSPRESPGEKTRQRPTAAGGVDERFARMEAMLRQQQAFARRAHERHAAATAEQQVLHERVAALERERREALLNGSPAARAERASAAERPDDAEPAGEGERAAPRSRCKALLRSEAAARTVRVAGECGGGGRAEELDLCAPWSSRADCTPRSVLGLRSLTDRTPADAPPHWPAAHDPQSADVAGGGDKRRGGRECSMDGTSAASAADGNMQTPAGHVACGDAATGALQRRVGALSDARSHIAAKRQERLRALQEHAGTRPPSGGGAALAAKRV